MCSRRFPGPKRMGVWAGTHEEIPPEAMIQANQFFARTLFVVAPLRAVPPEPYDHPVSLRVASSPYGRAAAQALRAEIARAKEHSPLAPVTVVVPGNSVGVAVRRLLASGELGPVSSAGVGLIGVNFLTAYRLAELLAAPRLAAAGRRPVSTPVVAAAVRRVLADRARPRCSRRVAEHPATEEALVSAHRELSTSKIPRSRSWPSRARGRARSCGSIDS